MSLLTCQQPAPREGYLAQGREEDRPSQGIHLQAGARRKGVSLFSNQLIHLLLNHVPCRSRETSDASALPESSLVNGQPVSLTDLGVTPQTVFISPRTVGIDAKSDLRRLKPLLGAEASSRRTSFTNRSSKGVENPLEEIRKKLATMEPPSTPAVSTVSDIPVPPSERSPSESAFGSSLDLAAMTKAGKKKVDSKAAPAVGASHANATGETAVPEDSIASSRMTPTASSSAPPRGPFTPYSSSYEGQDPGVRAYLEQIDLENYRQPLLDFGPRITASQRKRSPRPNPPSTGPGVTMIAHLTQHSGPVTAIVTAPDQAFFATASDDSQVLIWDTARLERSVATKARLTYRMDAPITAMSRLENTHCMAVAAEDGQVHVLRVHVTTSGSSVKYGRVECVRTWRTNVEKDGHVVFVSHLRGTLVSSPWENVMTRSRFHSACCHFYERHRTTRSPFCGIDNKIPKSTRVRRDHFSLRLDLLDNCRYRNRDFMSVGSAIWTPAQILESLRPNHHHSDPPCAGQRQVGYGLDRKDVRHSTRRGV